jgi:hypothetical protein
VLASGGGRVARERLRAGQRAREQEAARAAEGRQVGERTHACGVAGERVSGGGRVSARERRRAGECARAATKKRYYY